MDPSRLRDAPLRLYGHGGGCVGGDSHHQERRSTQYIWDARASYATLPLPVQRDADVPSGSSLPCVAQGLTTCYRGFSGEGLRACIYGMLMANDLIPSGAKGAVLDTDGGFSTGLGHSCATVDILPRRD